MVVSKGGIYRNCKILAHFDMLEEHLNRFLHVEQCLHHLLIIHEFARRDITVENVYPIHDLNKRFFGVPHDKVFCTFKLLVVDCSNHDLFQGTVHVIDKIIIMEIILVFLFRDGDVSVQWVYGISRRATMLLWKDGKNWEWSAYC